MPGTTPSIIQGGMGVGVSSWQLARAVARTGQLGVVSGTALDAVLARRLQDGDPDHHARRALADFPDQTMVARALDRYFLPEGREPGRPYRPTPKPALKPSRHAQELTVLGNYVEVWLAKQGHDGSVGINFLEKIQLATPAAALGAMLAGVDVVLMGAGVPREIPQLLTDLAAGSVAGVGVDVHGAEERSRIEVDPVHLLGAHLPPLRRPRFLAIVSATVLAAYLARDESTRPDGFVIEGPVAGGHNAPPRGTLVLGDDGEPVYGARDAVDLDKVAALGLPFWLAGGHGTPEGLAAARSAGAAGVQVGTLFALAAESGLRPELLDQVRTGLGSDSLRVRTDVRSSPTGFPFKVARLDGTLSEPEVYTERERLCDLGYLRTPYLTAAGRVGYRCPGEPVAAYQRKGGDVADTVGRMCLCNALTADVGLGQTRPDGYQEPGLVTLGTDLDGPRRLLERHPDGWTAAEAVAWIEGR
ncbi:nitronate monooxygenase [Nocardioides sp.]|uniref:nitronate monooxygenase n=1 Tax=Nocardioides sp. TaxID=35761 RepID=UPI002ED9455B